MKSVAGQQSAEWQNRCDCVVARVAWFFVGRRFVSTSVEHTVRLRPTFIAVPLGFTTAHFHYPISERTNELCIADLSFHVYTIYSLIHLLLCSRDETQSCNLPTNLRWAKAVQNRNDQDDDGNIRLFYSSSPCARRTFTIFDGCKFYYYLQVSPIDFWRHELCCTGTCKRSSRTSRRFRCWNRPGRRSTRMGCVEFWAEQIVISSLAVKIFRNLFISLKFRDFVADQPDPIRSIPWNCD